MASPTAIQGSHLLITGGASGIGLAIATEAMKRRARLITLWDRDRIALDRAVDSLAEVGPGRVRGDVVDVASPDDVREAALRSPDVDIVINSAGVVTGEGILTTTDDAIANTFAVNAMAPYWTTRSFLPGMLRRDRGCIVTVASAAGLIGVAGQIDYSPSKWAAVGFAESLRQELRKRRSSVNSMAVCPYYVDTGMFAGVTTRFPALLPILHPDTVAQAVLRGVEKGTAQVVMPPIVRLLPGLRLLPTFAFDWVMDFFAINSTMDTFEGRKGTNARSES